ncbi:MAG TPA: ABC transporter permease subunit [Micromonosporaceae bacterium]|nr:ABC transporter permease subunit [Micromonosporaceae bacterium]
MTSLTLPEAASRPTDRYGFREAVRAEWLKVRSVRSTRWLLALAAVAMIATGAGVGIGYRHHTPVATMEQIVDNSLSGAILAQLLVGAWGVLAMSSEYSSGTIRSTLLATPRRRLVLAAKLAVCAAITVPVGIAGSVGAFFAGQLAIRGTPIPHGSLANGDVLRPVLLTGAYVVVVGLLGLGLGTLIRHGVGAIGTLFGAMFVPLFLAGIFGESGIAVSRFVPMIILANSIVTTAPVPGALNAWAGIGVMVAYAALATGLGTVVLRRRDV